MAFFAKLFRKPPDLQEEIINMKLASKQLASASKKSEKNATKQKLAVKKAIQQNNIEGAKIYAEMAIREKKQGLQYLQMPTRSPRGSTRRSARTRRPRRSGASSTAWARRSSRWTSSASRGRWTSSRRGSRTST